MPRIAWICPMPLYVGVKSGIQAKPTLTPIVTRIYIVMIISEPLYQSQPSATIHCTYNEILEGLRCCETLGLIQTLSILVWNEGAFNQNCHHPWLKSWGVAMVRPEGFQSQPCTTIHHTYNETLEGLRCCELPKSVQSHSMVAWKLEYMPSQL